MSKPARAKGAWYPDPRAAGDNAHLGDALTRITDRLYAVEDSQQATALHGVPKANVPRGTSTPPDTVSPLGTSLGPSQPPASSTVAGTPGQFTFDGSYLYVCVAPNVWRRVAHSSF